jgi:hypothetical protein
MKMHYFTLSYLLDFVIHTKKSEFCSYEQELPDNWSFTTETDLNRAKLAAQEVLELVKELSE